MKGAFICLYVAGQFPIYSVEAYPSSSTICPSNLYLTAEINEARPTHTSRVQVRLLPFKSLSSISYCSRSQDDPSITAVETRTRNVILSKPPSSGNIGGIVSYCKDTKKYRPIPNYGYIPIESHRTSPPLEGNKQDGSSHLFIGEALLEAYSSADIGFLEALHCEGSQGQRPPRPPYSIPSEAGGIPLVHALSPTLGHSRA